MQLDERLCKYILLMIADKENYLELTSEDLAVKKGLEELFPDVVSKVERNLFIKWVFEKIVNGEESVVRAQYDVDMLASVLRKSQQESAIDSEVESLQKELSAKIDALHLLKGRLFYKISDDPQMMSALKRKWQEVTGTQVAPLISPPPAVP